MPKVSVIVPVYGAENYIEQCVRSIMEQTFRDLEIVLVDDGSKDRSGIICDELAGEDPRIRVIHKENGGLTSAWIRGVQESSGEYLCFVDSDDWISHDMIERLARLAKGGQVREIISSDYLIERMNGAARAPPRPENIRESACRKISKTGCLETSGARSFSRVV